MHRGSIGNQLEPIDGQADLGGLPFASSMPSSLRGVVSLGSLPAAVGFEAAATALAGFAQGEQLLPGWAGPQGAALEPAQPLAELGGLPFASSMASSLHDVASMSSLPTLIQDAAPANAMLLDEGVLVPSRGARGADL